MIKGIDIHAHAFPDDLVGRAMESLQSKFDEWTAHGCGSVRGLKESMAVNNIEKTALCCIATRPGQWQGILDWISHTVAGEDCYIPFASLHPDDENPLEILRKIKAAGVTAIKLHPMYQDFAFDDDNLMPIYQAAEELGLLVAFHCGKDIGFPDDPRPDRAAPHRLIKIIDKFDSLKILCTHMGGFLMWGDVEKYLVGCRAYFETSFGLTHMKPEQFVRIVKNHGDDKICFGSDWPWMGQGQLWQEILACGLDSETNDKIFRHNAVRLLGI